MAYDGERAPLRVGPRTPDFSKPGLRISDLITHLNMIPLYEYPHKICEVHVAGKHIHVRHAIFSNHSLWYTYDLATENSAQRVARELKEIIQDAHTQRHIDQRLETVKSRASAIQSVSREKERITVTFRESRRRPGNLTKQIVIVASDAREAKETVNQIQIWLDNARNTSPRGSNVRPKLVAQISP